VCQLAKARVDHAMLVASELVTNAVIHAHSQLRLLVELRSHQLHLAVHDADPHLLRLATAPEVLAEGGRGLPLVEALAASWEVQHPPKGVRPWPACSILPTDSVPTASGGAPRGSRPTLRIPKTHYCGHHHPER
jgi:Histidine kinase-like ATPase domain